jgi:hypothetical protein
MSVWRREFPTSPRLWLAFSVAAFAVAGCLLEVPVGRGSARYWELARAVARPEEAPPEAVALLLAFWGLVLAIPYLGVGWVLQALTQTVMGRKMRQGAS